MVDSKCFSRKGSYPEGTKKIMGHSQFRRQWPRKLKNALLTREARQAIFTGREEQVTEWPPFSVVLAAILVEGVVAVDRRKVLEFPKRIKTEEHKGNFGFLVKELNSSYRGI